MAERVLKAWLTTEHAELVRLYADTTNAQLAQHFACTVPAVQNVAARLGLRKSPEHRRAHGVRLRRRFRGETGHFKNGHTPWNKRTE